MTDIKVNPESPQAVIAALHEKNGQRLQALDAENAQIPDIAIINSRLNLLIDFLVGPAVRAAFDLAFEHMIEAMLDEWEPQVRQAKLLQGVVVEAPKDIT